MTRVAWRFYFPQPERELLGITPVSGETVKRAMIASILSAGCMRWSPDLQGEHDVAMMVDIDRFYDHYFTILRNA
jgi:hypothetical protein